MYPRLLIHPDRLLHNTQSLVQLAARSGVSLMGVTKVACAHPAVTEALIKGGIAYLADSRVENLRALKETPIKKVLLRLPMASEVEEVVEVADISLNSEPATIAALGQAALRQGKEHGVVLMVDLGDLREGVLPEEVLPVAENCLHLPGIKLVGLGVNLTCYGGVIPDEDNLGQLASLAETLENRFDLHLELISGGNSSSVKLLQEGRLPKKINNLRLGEVLMLGRETVDGDRFFDTRDDVFELEAQLIEVRVKDSLPKGRIGMDAFGKKPVFEDKGKRKRGILAIGRQDVQPDGLTPLDPGVEIIGASSDHLIVDLTEASEDFALGDILRFSVDYGALLALMTSPYVKKETR